MTNYYIKIKNVLNEVTIYSTQAKTTEEAERKAKLAYKFGGNETEITDIIIREI